MAQTVLDYVYKREKEEPNRPWMIQPMGGGTIKNYTWGEGLKEARRLGKENLRLRPRDVDTTLIAILEDSGFESIPNITPRMARSLSTYTVSSIR